MEARNDRQQSELQTLKVRNCSHFMHCTLYNEMPQFAFRKREEGYRQSWRLWLLKMAGNRESYRH